MDKILDIRDPEKLTELEDVLKRKKRLGLVE